MSIPDENLKDFENFPAALRRLVENELKAGNEVVEFGHGFPAAPCGAYIKLASPVSTRDRAATAELSFYDRDSRNYSGEFTDANRHFFVLEPPHPPSPVPDMQAIRVAIDAEYSANAALQLRGINRSTGNDDRVDMLEQDKRGEDNLAGDVQTPIVQRFVQSMEIDYDKWREGESYDLALLESASDGERVSIQQILIQHSPRNWRDIEALAAINSPRGRAAIMESFSNADTETRMAVHRYAPELLTQQLRTDSIVRALSGSTMFFGLSKALDEVEDFHPPAIIQELLRGLMKRDGETACHFAAMLYFLNGKSSSKFDWDYRPFFLRFNTDDLNEREKVVRELCEVIGVDPTEWLLHVEPEPAPDMNAIRAEMEERQRAANADRFRTGGW